MGPIDIELNVYERIIIIKTTYDWKDLITKIKPIIIEAWGCKNEDIIQCGSTKYQIDYDIELLEKYLTRNIILK